MPFDSQMRLLPEAPSGINPAIFTAVGATPVFKLPFDSAPLQGVVIGQDAVRNRWFYAIFNGSTVSHLKGPCSKTLVEYAAVRLVCRHEGRVYAEEPEKEAQIARLSTLTPAVTLSTPISTPGAEQPKVWTKEEIRSKLLKSDHAVERAICALYRRQVEGERRIKATKLDNKVGFTAAHARPASYLAEWMDAGHKDGKWRRALTGTVKHRGQEVPRIQVAREIALHYVKQLTDLANTPGDPMVKTNPRRF